MFDNQFKITQLVIKTRSESWSKSIYSKLNAWYCELLKKSLCHLSCPKGVWNQAWFFVRTNICAHLKVAIHTLKTEGKANLGWANYEIICSLLKQKQFFPNSILSKPCTEIELNYFKSVGDQWKYLKFWMFKLVFHSLWIFGTQNSPLTSLSYWKF